MRTKRNGETKNIDPFLFWGTVATIFWAVIFYPLSMTEVRLTSVEDKVDIIDKKMDGLVEIFKGGIIVRDNIHILKDMKCPNCEAYSLKDNGDTIVCALCGWMIKKEDNHGGLFMDEGVK